VRSGTIILVDPDVRHVGIDLDALDGDLRRLGIGRTMLVPGLARHPELLTDAVRSSGARRAVVVSATSEHPPLSELRMWGEAGGLAPLAVNKVALDIVRARRSTLERSTYAARMVRAAVAALDAPGTARAARRPLGGSLSRRALLHGRATTWVPVADVRASSCLGMLSCGRCQEACPEDALVVNADLVGSSPVVDASRCDGCSACLDVCPTGALSLDGHDPGTMALQLKALLQEGVGAATPALIIACQVAAGPLHHLGERSGLPGWLVLEVACLGGVGSAWQLAALAAGARTVQLLPCARCENRGSVIKGLDFTRSLLAAIGDAEASRRVGMLPSGGAPLKRAVHAASQLGALTNETSGAGMPTPVGVEASARVSAWAVHQLQQALCQSVPDQHPKATVIIGESAPLGVLQISGGCTACGVCTRSCPTNAMSLRAGLGGTELVLDPAACTGCGACVHTCPEDVLSVARGVDLELLAGGRLTIARVAVATCPGCGDNVPALPATAQMSPMPADLASRCPRCRQAALIASL